MASFLTTLLYSQLFVTPPLPTQSFEGKTVIVTGANSGLGYEAAKQFLELNAKSVILAVRNPEKGEAARDQLLKDINLSSEIIQVWQLDMSSYESVRNFAGRVHRELPRVDAVVENAGFHTFEYSIAEEDESLITVNVVSTFLLALLLLPTLRRCAEEYCVQPVISIVGSSSHLRAKFEERHAEKGEIFKTLNKERQADMSDRYPTSKLIQVFCARALAARMGPNPPVTLNVVNPGLCWSNITRGIDTLGGKVMLNVLARKSDVGARTLVAGVTAGPKSHGEYMNNSEIATTAKMVLGEEGSTLQEAVWHELCEKLERICPGVTSNASLEN